MKAKFGSVVVAGSGKLGGSVFSVNRGRAILGNLNRPAGRVFNSQSNQRALFASVVSRWKTLSASEQFAWSVFAPSLKSVDVWGDSIPLDGFHAFVRCNIYRLLGNHPILLSPVVPALWSSGVIDNYFSWFEESDFGFIIILKEPPSYFGDIIFQASRQVSPGMSADNIRPSMIKVFQSFYAYEFDPVSEYENKFGKVVPSNRRFLCRLIFVCPLSGVPYQILNLWMPVPFILS